MAVHRCAQFCNNPLLVHERAVRIIAKYLTSTSTYTYLPDGDIRLSTHGIVYSPDEEKNHWMLHGCRPSPVVGIEQIPITQKMACSVRDARSRTRDVRYYGTVSYIRKSHLSTTESGCIALIQAVRWGTVSSPLEIHGVSSELVYVSRKVYLILIYI